MDEWLVYSWEGSIECHLKGCEKCENEAGCHEFDSTIGQCEMECTHKVTTSDFENLKNVRECDKQYGSYYEYGPAIMAQLL